MATEAAAASPRHLVLNHYAKDLEGRFLWALGLTALVLVAEIAGGLWTRSLALLSDAAHVLMDVVALGLSYVALRLAARDPSDRYSYGLHRAEVLAAVLNGGTLLVIASGIFLEAGRRVQAPEPVKSLQMLLIAGAGLAVNLVVMLALRGHTQTHDEDHPDLNVRSAWLHVLGDTLSSVGVIATGLIMWRTGWVLLDPLVSFGIAAVLLVGSGRLLKSGIHILMEGVPEGLDFPSVGRTMAVAPGVREVHDLHIWSLCAGAVALSAHVTMDSTRWNQGAEVLTALQEVLRHRFGIEHTTIQLECTQCPQGLMTCAGDEMPR